MNRRAVAVDLVFVLFFVAIGRSVHDHGINVSGLASTAWPFAIGVAVGWLLVVALGRTGTSIAGGLIVTVTTVVLGMLLRVVAGQGTAFAFILVALGFLGAFMLGWRVALGSLQRVRARRPGA